MTLDRGRQAGLVEVALRKFRVAGGVSAAYAAASVALHAAWLAQRGPADHASPTLTVLLFTLQRCR